MKKLYSFLFIFLFSILTRIGYAQEGEDSLYVRVFESHELIVEGGRTIGTLPKGEEQLMPIGTEKQIGNQSYVTAVEELDFNPIQTTMANSAWLSVPPLARVYNACGIEMKI